MELVEINELEEGDVILIEGQEEGEIYVVTVKEVYDELIIPAELGGLDYSPPNPYSIIRLNRNHRIKDLTK